MTRHGGRSRREYLGVPTLAIIFDQQQQHALLELEADPDLASFGMLDDIVKGLLGSEEEAVALRGRHGVRRHGFRKIEAAANAGQAQVILRKLADVIREMFQ